jgi:hypothetical protein
MSSNVYLGEIFAPEKGIKSGFWKFNRSVFTVYMTK